jgi:DNA-directed RNA polymerase subunit F
MRSSNAAAEMARLIIVLKPRGPAAGHELIPKLMPALERLDPEFDHQGPSHLSAVMRVPPHGMVVQIFADVQPQADGPELDVVLMSSETMIKGAPQTLQAFTKLISLLPEHAGDLELIFRSDRDGPVPRQGSRHLATQS